MTNENLIETAVGLLSDDVNEWDDNPEYTRAICELVTVLGNFEDKGEAWLALARWASPASPFHGVPPTYLAGAS